MLRSKLQGRGCSQQPMTGQHSPSPGLHRKPISHVQRSTERQSCSTDFVPRWNNAIVTTQLRFQTPDRIGELEAEIATLRGRESEEMRDLRVANRNMAQHIQALSLLVRDHEQRIAKLQHQLELSESARVVPLVGLARR